MLFLESNYLSKRKISKLSFLDKRQMALRIIRWLNSSREEIQVKLTLLNTYTSLKLKLQAMLIWSSLSWKRWLRTRSKRWALSSMKWDKTSFRPRMPTRCPKVLCTDKLKWWTAKSTFLRKTKNRSGTSFAIWWTKALLALRALETSSKMCSTRTVEWCLRWWRQSTNSSMKWRFSTRTPSYAPLTLVVKLTSSKKWSLSNKTHLREATVVLAQIPSSPVAWTRISWRTSLTHRWSERAWMRSKSKWEKSREKPTSLRVRWTQDSKAWLHRTRLRCQVCLCLSLKN